jgi:hypothetical protein
MLRVGFLMMLRVGFLIDIWVRDRPAFPDARARYKRWHRRGVTRGGIA